MILTQARRITQSDGGSLYLVEGRDTPQPRLRFKLTQGDTLPSAGFVEFTMPLDHASQAGYVCSTGEPLVIDDVYFLPPDVQYSFNRSFDERNKYRSKSMLTVPMKNHKDEVIGALQLINRKRDPHATARRAPRSSQRQVIPFSRRTVEIVSALAGQAAVSIENSLLYEDIERLFEGFVTAAVTAIEQRDPTTSGHSGRVATMTVGLAEVVDRSGRRPVPARQLLARADQGDPLRQPAARLRQGRRARAGAGQGEEALPAGPLAHPQPLRLHQALRRGGVPPGARRLPRRARPRGLRGVPRAARRRAPRGRWRAWSASSRPSSRPTSRRCCPRAASRSW